MANKVYFKMTEDQMNKFVFWVYYHNIECERLTGEKIIEHISLNTTGNYIFDFPESIDWYLYKFCDIEFVQEQLAMRYDLKTNPPVNGLDNFIWKLYEACNYNVNHAIDIIVYIERLTKSYGKFSCFMDAIARLDDEQDIFISDDIVYNNDPSLEEILDAYKNGKVIVCKVKNRKEAINMDKFVNSIRNCVQIVLAEE